MQDSMTKNISMVSYALLGISTLMSVLYYAGAIGEDAIIYWCYALAGVALILAVVFPVLILAQNPKAAKTTLVGVLALIVLTGLSYALADSSIHKSYLAYGTTESGSKWVSTGLIAFYLLAAGAIVATVYSEVSKMFK